MSYKLTVGLEIHARLNTKTKMFCACVNENFDTRPNTNICPICTAQPGQLPQLNQEAVNLAIRLALALNAKLSSPFRFDRKSYFYPDNPKGFQITQFATPILRNGSLEIETKAGVKNIHILEAHLEDDAGKLVHEGNNSLVDLNRAGCPLIEIVTAPDFNDLIEVDVFLKELQKLLRYLSVSEADMEKGMLRVDVNISVSKDENLGQRIEIKNMNSFSEIMKAIAYEQKRQGDLLEQGIKIEPETRGWDVNKGQSFLQRSKENAADYRYFPEPDLPPYLVKEEQIARISQDLVELPRARYLRFMKDYELPAADAFLLTEDRLVADYYEAVLKQANFPKKVANWILSELFAYLKADQKSIGESLIKPGHLAELILLIEDDIISGKIAKSIFPEMYQTGKNPTVIVDDNGLRQNSNIAELESICQEIIQSNPQIVSDYKAGKTRLFGALIGQVMKKTQGQANPGLVNEILLRYLQ